LLYEQVTPVRAEDICRRWRLANKETDLTRWLVENYKVLDNASASQWSAIQPYMVDTAAVHLVDLIAARAEIGLVKQEEAQWCRNQLERDRDELDPPPLLTGDDLIDAKLPQGPRYRVLLQRVRDAQLDGEIESRADALALVRRLTGEK
jgi:hypothetical protein